MLFFHDAVAGECSSFNSSRETQVGNVEAAQRVIAKATDEFEKIGLVHQLDELDVEFTAKLAGKALDHMDKAHKVCEWFPSFDFNLQCACEQRRMIRMRLL